MANYRFSEAILDYLNVDSNEGEGVENGEEGGSPEKSKSRLTRQDFSQELDTAHDTLYSAWLTSGVLNRYAS